MKKGLFLSIVLLSGCLSSAAQTGLQASAMKYDESVTYDVYFKWGVIMPRAGEVVLSYYKDRSVSNASSRYRLTFKTSKFFDNFFQMRDTLDTYYDDDNRLIYSRKGSFEGDYYTVDELTFNYSDAYTKIHSLRYTPKRVKIDTTMITTDEISDLLGTLYYLRGIDRFKLSREEGLPITVVIGRSLVKTQFRYQNQSVVERSDAKYNTRYFKIDISDDAFESTKTSAEVWVSDDDNFLPIKIRSKLKIGYAEIHFKHATGLAHPMKCKSE
ncbi:MAG: DUF3108 domain-containing protein [Tannerella sp.]|nr:DUF3108 domain-containing protein [Tannerella sp.]